MGQKVHPITVRLQNNRTFDAGWFNDNFAEAFKKEFLLRRAITSFFGILSQTISGTTIHLGRIYFQQGYMKNIITLFIYKEDNVKESKNRYKVQKPGKLKRKTSFNYSKRNFRNSTDLQPSNNHSFFGKDIIINGELNKSYLSFKTEKSSIFSLLQKNLVTLISKKQFNKLFFFYQPNHKSIKEVLVNASTRRDKKIFNELVFRMIYFCMLETVSSIKDKQIKIESTLLRKLDWNRFENKGHLQASKESFTKKVFIENQKAHKLLIELENSLSSLSNENIHIRPIFSTKSTFSASFLADKIISIFEKNQKKKKTPYKAIKRFLNKSPSKCLGFRVLCSGRLGGVEMAKKFSIKKGQTSLNVFSQKMDFSYRKALTKYGIIGIKVWISFK
uniref:ribosomal protein S3 n=1 Tax=Tetraselmis marina TaxID=41888 RepID=UPI00218255AA|nr:ribosomal protein S3 [Tetraselmis marina]UVF37920.1 ribosomal protein S3 [Tetraselmis marina]